MQNIIIKRLKDTQNLVEPMANASGRAFTLSSGIDKDFYNKAIVELQEWLEASKLD